MTESVWGPVHRDVVDLLADHPADVPAVVEHLAKLQDVLVRLPPSEGGRPLADLNALYLTITGTVLRRLYDGSFADPVFLSRLDVDIAARYFDALRRWTESSPYTPRAWACVFECIAGPDVRPLPVAAAGMNAHINVDLPFALVTIFEHLESEPADDGDQHRDYLQINEIFAESIPTLRRGYLDRWQLIIDTLNGDLDDWYQGELVAYTRGVAWRNAQRIWRVRHDAHARERERGRLDGTAARLGRLLLSPLGALLQ